MRVVCFLRILMGEIKSAADRRLCEPSHTTQRHGFLGCIVPGLAAPGLVGMVGVMICVSLNFGGGGGFLMGIVTASASILKNMSFFKITSSSCNGVLGFFGS